MYIPLNLKSHYSILQSTNKIPQLCKRLKEYGIGSACLSDISSLSGTVEFIKLCKGANIRAITGSVFFVGLPTGFSYQTINLIAKSLTGWKNLLKLTQLANTTGYNTKEDIPTITIPDLLEHSNGLICIIHSFDGLTYNIAEEYRPLIDCFGTDFYFGINTQTSHLAHTSEKVSYFRQLAHNLNVKPVAISHDQCLDQEDVPILRMSYATKLKTTYKDYLKAVAKHNNKNIGVYYESNRFCLMNEEQMRLCNTPEEVDNTEEVASKCEDYSIFSGPVLPDFKCPDGLTSDQYLRQLCRVGWTNKIKGQIPKEKEGEYADRVKRELGVFEEANLAPYFLIVQDYVNAAKNREDLVGVARGSVGGSLVAYILNITELDPIPYDLIFERFYNAGRNSPGRISLPDIDIDFPAYKRDDTLNYIRDRYNKDNVARIATFGKFKGSEALKNVLRIHNTCSFSEMNRITDFIPEESKISDELEEMRENKEEPSIIKWALRNEGEKLSEWCILQDDETLIGPLAPSFHAAMKVEGLIKSYGSHASGYIISKTPMWEWCPLMRSKNDEHPLAGMPMDDLAELGLSKFDILATTVLDKMQDILEN